jgi:hypothetical protein
MFSSTTLFSIDIRQITFVLFPFTENMKIGIQFHMGNDNHPALFKKTKRLSRSLHEESLPEEKN